MSAVKRVIIPAVVAVVFVILERPLPAAVLAVVALALLAVGLVRPRWAERLDSALFVFASWLAQAIGWVSLSVVWVVAVVPAWLVSTLTRRSALRPAGVIDRSSWGDRTDAVSRTRSGFVDERGLDVRAGGPGLLGRIPTVVGLGVLALALNYGIGWTYDEFIGSHDVPVDDGAATGGVEQFLSSPAVAGEPWVGDYVAEFQSLEYEYEPYVLTLVQDTDGPLITVEDGARVSYEPENVDGAEVPEVWFFGGSLVFGQGQRDDHTIPSAVARLADEAGEPVRVVNFAQPGHTTWQQWHHFERLLARRAAPDVAVFVGGYDDVRVQMERPSVEPTHYNVNGAGQSLAGDAPLTDVGDVVEEYQDRSVITRLARGLSGIIGVAGAAEADEPPEAATAAADVHRRARIFLEHLGRRDGVEIITVWQPAPVTGPVVGPFDAMVGQADDDVEDLSRLLDDRPELFVDDRHLNEAGAGVVAKDLYRLVAEQLDPAT